MRRPKCRRGERVIKFRRGSECTPTIRVVSDARQALPPSSSARPPARLDVVWSALLQSPILLSLPLSPLSLSPPARTRLAFAAVVELLSVSRLAPQAKEAKGTKSSITQDGGNRLVVRTFVRAITTRETNYPPCIPRRSGPRSGSRRPCRRKPCRGPDRCRRILENEGEEID